MNSLNLITRRQQVASLAIAAVMTVAVLASLVNVANGYHTDVARAQAGTADNVVVQQVVVTGKRLANS